MKHTKQVTWATASLSVLLAASLLSGPAQAEEQPGVGRKMLEKKDRAPVIEQQKKPVPVQPGVGKKVLVKKFRFEGNTIFSDEQLETVVAPAEGKELTLEEMKGVADQVTARYREAGYLITNAVIPPQNVTDNVVTIKIVEAKVGNVIVTGNKSYSEAFIKRYLSKVKNDPSLQEDTLERQLLLLNDYPSLAVKAALKAGEKPGTTDLIASVSDHFPISGSLSFDNFGVKTTSKDRLSGSLDIGNLLTSGDLLMLRGTMGLDSIDLDKLSYGRAEYVVPVGGYGTQIGVYYTDTVYAAGQTLSPLEINGSANIGGIYVSHPLLRKLDSTLSGRLGFEAASVKDNIFSTTLNHKDEIRKITASLNYDVTDRYLGRNFIGFSYARGLGEFLGGSGSNDTAVLPNGTIIPISSRPGANDAFNKLTLDAIRIQKLPGYNHLIIRGSGQYSPDRLFIAEEFIVGGEGTVRGYDSANKAGDSGLFGSLELVVSPFFPDKMIFSQKVGDTIKFAMFTDYGRVFITDPQPGEYSSTDEWSAGAGARLYATKYFTALVDWAVPHEQGGMKINHSKTYVQVKVSF